MYIQRWILGSLLVTFSLFSIAQETGKPAPASARMLSSEAGRYVFGQVSEYRRDQYLLDTRTGRLWQKVVAKVGEAGKEQEVSVLEPIYFVGQDGKWSLEPK